MRAGYTTRERASSARSCSRNTSLTNSQASREPDTESAFVEIISPGSRLYNDDFRSIMRAQRGILRANLTYMRYSMAPMIWTLPPLILLIAQLQFHYGYSGLTPGQEVLLKIEVASDTTVNPTIGGRSRNG